MKRHFLLALMLINLASLPLMAMDNPGSIPTLSTRQSEALRAVDQYAQKLFSAKSPEEFMVYLNAIIREGSSEELCDIPEFIQYIWQFIQKVFVSHLTDANKYDIISGLAFFIPLQHQCRKSFDQMLQFLSNKYNPSSLSTPVDDPLADFIAEAIQTNNLMHVQELLKYAADATHKAQLLSACETIQKQQAEASTSITNVASQLSKRIIIETGNVQHLVDEKIINLCSTLQEMASECGTDIPLPLPEQISSVIFTKLVSLLRAFHASMHDADQQKQNIEKALQSETLETLLPLFETANYVQAPQLIFDAIRARIISLFSDKNSLIKTFSNPSFCSALSSIDSNADLRNMLVNCCRETNVKAFQYWLKNIACNITIKGREDFFSWSPDGSYIAVKLFDFSTQHIKLTLFPKDGSRPTELCSLPYYNHNVQVAGDGNFSWSPDGSCIVVQSHDFIIPYDYTTKNFILTICSKDGSPQKKLCSLPNICTFSWSPDSSCIAVTSRDSSNGNYTLTIYSKDGSQPKQLCSSSNINKFSWSSDGSCIAVSAYDSSTRNFTLTIFSKDGKQLCSLPNISEFTWGPESSCITVQSWDSSRNEILTIFSIDGSPQKQLCSLPNIHDFSWSPDGSCIAVKSWDSSTGNFTLTIFSKDGKQLCSLPNISKFTWSPDGSYIAVKSWDSLTRKDTITICYKDGSKQKPLCSLPNISEFTWSPDGSCIAVKSWDSSTRDEILTIFSKDGKQLCSLPNIGDFSWSPDASCIAVDRGNQLTLCKKELLFLLNRLSLTQNFLLMHIHHCIENNQRVDLASFPPQLAQACNTLPIEVINAMPDYIKTALLRWREVD